MNQTAKTVGAMLIIVVTMSACILGGVPFKLESYGTNDQKLYQPEADCYLDQGAPTAITEWGQSLTGVDCYNQICAISAYREVQFCRLLTGEVDPNDLEISLTIQSLQVIIENFNQSMAR